MAPLGPDGWHMLKKVHHHPRSRRTLRKEEIPFLARKFAQPPLLLPPFSPSFSNGSPEPPIWPSPSSAPLQPDLALTTLLTLPALLNHFSALPTQLQSHFLLTLLRHSPLPVLRTLHSVLTPTLARDFLTLLPLNSSPMSFPTFPSTPSLAPHASQNLGDQSSSQIPTSGKTTSFHIDSGSALSESAFANAIYARRNQPILPTPSLSLPHPYLTLFKSRMLTRSEWVNNPSPKHHSFRYLPCFSLTTASFPPRTTIPSTHILLSKAVSSLPQGSRSRRLGSRGIKTLSR